MTCGPSIKTVPRVVGVSTHPIQYLSPIYDRLAGCQRLAFHALYASLGSVQEEFDPGFNRKIKWDVPVLGTHPFTVANNLGPGVRKGGFLSHRCSDVTARLWALKPDVVLLPGYSSFFYIQALIAAKRYGARILLRGDNKDVRDRRRWLHALLRSLVLRGYYANVDGFLAVGSYMRRHFVAHGVSEASIWDSPHAVDSEPFDRLWPSRALIRAELREKLRRPKDETFVLFAGRLVGEKNVPQLADAFSKAIQARAGRATLVVVGDGPLRATLEQTWRPLLRERLALVGFINQSELPKYYLGSDIFAMPSRDSWGLAVNEAMTAGLAVIVSDRCGCHEDLVRRGVTGLLCRYGSVEDLAAQLLILLHRPNLRRLIGAAARAHIKRYSVQKAAEGICTAAELVCNSRPTR